MRAPLALLPILAAWGFFSFFTQNAPENANLVTNPNFTPGSQGGPPLGYQITGDAEYRYLGDPSRDMSGWGVALDSARHQFGAGSVSQTIANLDPKAGRWFRFTFRGLPQDGFAVMNGNLYMKAEFFGGGGRVAYDGKSRGLDNAVEQARRDLSVNGVRRTGGAEVWRTYTLDFRLPFPQVDEVRLTVGFGNAAGVARDRSSFFVGDFSLVRIPPPPGAENATASGTAAAISAQGKRIALGGRWYYDAKPGETAPPATFDNSNATRLLYWDGAWSAPFAGNMTAWLRAGNKDMGGNVVDQDRLVPDNVTVNFDATSLIIHTHSLPNHPTGKFPEQGAGGPGGFGGFGFRRGNPSYIQEQLNTYYIPLNPQPNLAHTATARDNSNHALPMGPIGIAANGVVFFNPFDMGNQDATDLMDRCCGHPNPDNLYHYHKYPICVNSPWDDDGRSHSPVLGWAFDGYPIYGPYESAGVMAKDVQGMNALNEFNIHFDPNRGWHYHVTPGRFPYIIGGYWGSEDPRDRQRPRHPPGSGMGGGPPPEGGRPFPPGFGPPP